MKKLFKEFIAGFITGVGIAMFLIGLAYLTKPEIITTSTTRLGIGFMVAGVLMNYLLIKDKDTSVKTSDESGYPIIKNSEIIEVKRNYYIKKEIWAMPGSEVEMISAYNKHGDYIGNEETAKRLCDERGIYPEKASPSHSVCSIGFCKRSRKWYGWSHRAIFGFQVGDVVKDGDVCAEYLPIGFTAQILEDCKTMAIAFAKSVS